MIFEEDLELTLNYHVNSYNFPSKGKYFLGEFLYELNSSKQYVPHPYDIYFNKIKHGNFTKSVRRYSNIPVEKEKIIQLISQSYSIEGDKSLYNPSAGNILPVEMYLIVKSVIGINEGVFHYERNNKKLTYLFGHKKINFLSKINQFAHNANVIICLTCKLDNLLKKYGSRGYRYALLECGHIGQNIYLNSQKTGLGCCAIGGFYDELLSNYLSLGKYEFPMYLIALGKGEEIDSN